MKIAGLSLVLIVVFSYHVENSRQLVQDDDSETRIVHQVLDSWQSSVD